MRQQALSTDADTGSLSAAQRYTGDHAAGSGSSTDVDLLCITAREPETAPESTLPCGQARATSIAFGSARVAARDLFIEAIAAGQEPMKSLRVDNVVLFSPDIDLDIARKDVTFGISDPGMFTVRRQERRPRALGDSLTVYSSPQDRALRVSRLLFRSQSRAGNVRAEDVSMELRRYVAPFNRFDIVVFEGKRTDLHGHFYFTTNPRVSSDLIQLLRYGKKPGEPGRELAQVEPIVWKFPTVAKR